MNTYRIMLAGMLGLLVLNSCGQDEINPIVVQEAQIMPSGEGHQGSCGSYGISGHYQEGLETGDDHILEVEVEVLEAGSYTASTQALGGLKFEGSGVFKTAGRQDVVLKAVGTPDRGGNYQFNIQVNGLEFCSISLDIAYDLEQWADRIIISSGSPFMGDLNKLYAMKGSGEKLWVRDFASAIPAIAQDVLYITNAEDQIEALDVMTGTTIWKSSMTDASIYTSITYHNDTLYFTNTSGSLYAMNAKDGSVYWQYSTNYSAMNSSSPTVSNGVVYFGSPDEHLYAIHSDGSLKWKSLINQASDIRSNPLVANNRVYITADNGMLYSLDAGTGELLWEKQTGSDGAYSASLHEDKIFVQGENTVFALNAEDGSELWRYEDPEGPGTFASPYYSKGIVFVGGASDGLTALDANTGEFLWNNMGPGYYTNSPVALDDVVYATGGDGMDAILVETGRAIWSIGSFGASGSEIIDFFEAPIVYNTTTKAVYYPSETGNQ